MKKTLAGAAALAMLVAAHGGSSSALAQTAAPTGTGVRGGANGQGPTGFKEAPDTGSSRSATPRASRQEQQEERRQTSSRPRPSDPRDRAYMDGGMVGGTAGSDTRLSPGAGGTTGGGSSLGAPPAGRIGSTTGTGPGATGGVGSGNQPGTGGTTSGR